MSVLSLSAYLQLRVMVFRSPTALIPGCLPQRYLICLLCFLSLVLSYIMRFCLSLSITEMVIPRVHTAAHNNDPNACPYQPTDNASLTNGTIHKTGEFDWSEETQGLVLSSFFWGYVVTQLPGGLLAERCGGKAVLGGGILVSSVGTLLTPWAARVGSAPGIIVARVIIGLGQGVVYPSLHALTAQWVPTEERGRLGCFVFAGANFGNVVSMSLTGVLLGLYPGGWPLIFYLYGGAGIIWLILWYMFSFSTPAQHPHLSEKERKFMMKYSSSVQMNKTNTATPWRGILKSAPLWGLVLAQVGHDWGLFTIVTDLPKYMKSVMHFTITQNGLLLALPYLLMWAVALATGALADWILKKNLLSTTATRKIFTTFASLGPGLGILGATYSGCNRGLATSCFILGMGLMGFFYPSLKVNPLDLSPNFAGTISAFVIGIGAISGIISPYLVGLLTPDSTLLQWRLVFWIAVIVLAVTNLVYVLVGSGEVQPWNHVEPPQKDSEREEKTQ